MTRLVEFPLAQGGTIVVDADEPGAPGLERAALPGEIAEQASQSVQAAHERIKRAVAEIIAMLRSLAEAPDEVTVELGIKLSAKPGIAVIAAAEAEANYKLTLTGATCRPARPRPLGSTPR